MSARTGIVIYCDWPGCRRKLIVHGTGSIRRAVDIARESRWYRRVEPGSRVIDYCPWHADALYGSKRKGRRRVQQYRETIVNA